MNILIFGAGKYGLAISSILSNNFHQVNFYDPIKYQKFTSQDLSYKPINSSVNKADNTKNPLQTIKPLIKNADAVFICTPSTEVHNILNDLKSLNYQKPIISTSKGLLYDKNLPDNFSILFGPAFAKDLINQKPTTLTITNSLTAFLLKSPFLKFEFTSDLAGAILSSTLKNIYAVYSGANHLTCGTKAFTHFINNTYRELKTALAFYNYDQNTADLACGLKDLILTTSSTSSRNYTFGQNLNNKNFTPESTTESINIVKQYQLELSKIPNTPILHDTIKLICHSIHNNPKL